MLIKKASFKYDYLCELSILVAVIRVTGLLGKSFVEDFSK